MHCERYGPVCTCAPVASPGPEWAQLTPSEYAIRNGLEESLSQKRSDQVRRMGIIARSLYHVRKQDYPVLLDSDSPVLSLHLGCTDSVAEVWTVGQFF